MLQTGTTRPLGSASSPEKMANTALYREKVLVAVRASSGVDGFVVYDGGEHLVNSLHWLLNRYD